MAKNFAAIAFTNAVKVMQEKLGSRPSYARMERAFIDEIREVFIAQQDHIEKLEAEVKEMKLKLRDR